MKILVAGGLPSSLINFRGNLLVALQATGAEVIASAGGNDPETEMALKKMGVRYEPMPLASQGTNPRADLTYKKAFRRLLLHEKPDIVLSYTIKPVLYGGLAAKGLPAVNFFPLITGLGYAFSKETLKQRFIHLGVRQLYIRSLSRASAVMFQNEDDQALFRESGLMRADLPSVVLNGSGIDLARFPRMPMPSGPTTFLLIARLVREKGIYDFVEAAKIVRATQSDVRFLLVGGSDQNPSSITTEQAQAWSVEGTIEYLGELKDVRKVLASCHVFVLPSYYREGSPRTILEAMATGRAVITCDTPGCRQTVVVGETGTLVPPRSRENLAEQMLAYHHDRDRIIREGNAARARAEDIYDVVKVNKEILNTMGLEC